MFGGLDGRCRFHLLEHDKPSPQKDRLIIQTTVKIYQIKKNFFISSKRTN